MTGVGVEAVGGAWMKVEFSGDELILMLVSLVRAVDPRMLQQGPEGFSVDFQTLAAKKELTADERLLMKLREAIARAENETRYTLAMETAEGERLAGALERIEGLGAWAPDVLEMSRGLRRRLLESQMNTDKH